MKFGGTSVESAEAIERVTGIVKSRLDRRPDRRCLGDGQDHQPAAENRRPRRLRPTRRSAARIDVAARFSSPRIRHGAHRRRTFSGTLGTGERPGGAGRTDAALHRRHLQFRRALVQPDRHELFPAPRPQRRARGFAQSDRYRSSPHAGHSAPGRNLRQARGRHSAACEAARGGDGRLHRLAPKTASPPRSAAAVPISRLPSSARGSAPKRSKSGPTWTACSPPTRTSFRMRTASR